MNTKKKINRRAVIVGVGITLLFFVLILRTFYIQTIDAPMLNEKANNIWKSSSVIEPKRGTIFDRNGERLAHDAQAYNVIAILSKDYPNHVNNPRDTANKLAPILGMEESKLYTLLTKDAYQVELRPGGWKIDKDKADQIRELNLPGIILKEDTKRYYPNNYFASYTLGFLNYDNEAVMGIERQYDEVLRGKPGELKVMKDRRGYQLPDGEEFYQPAEDGSNLVLTLDKTIQQYVESALDAAEAMYNPKSMVAIVANPKTGEILGMSNRPNFNPNKYWEIEEYSNYAISYQFEPGSTFKIVTLAAAIEEGIFDPNKTYQSGKIEVPGKVINDHNDGKGWGEITFLEGVQRSSNVAFVLLGNELGKDKLYYYIEEFGFGQKTGIDLPGESIGQLKDKSKAYPLDVASMSFGQGIAVTPIQQLMAVSAVANGGNLMEPYLVKEIRDPHTGEIIEQREPTVKHRVISEEAAKETRDVLEQVVEFGQQKGGYIEGYHVAGKTGTAQKIGPDGKYLKDKNIASFIGFAPADDPELIVYVIVDEPDLNIPYYGSTVAVPIFKDIMLNSLRYLKVPIDSETSTKLNYDEIVTVGNYLNGTVTNANKQISDSGLTSIVIGNKDKVLEQYPAPQTGAPKGSKVYLITDPKGEIKVPDLTGMSLRDAIDLCSVLGIEVKIKGSGVVESQSLKPNTIYKGGQLEITLKDPATYKEDNSDN